MKTKILVILLSIAFLPITLFVLLYFLSMSMVFIMFLIGHITAPNPDVPEIKYGEFPYEIIYMTDGEVHTASGIYVCEYDGIDYSPSSMGQTKELVWKSYIKEANSKNERVDEYIPLFQKDNIEVYLDIGEPGYYMGQQDVEQIDDPELICYVISEKVKEIPERAGEIFKEVCDVEIISWNLPVPIENTFVPKKWYEFWK